MVKFLSHDTIREISCHFALYHFFVKKSTAFETPHVLQSFSRKYAVFLSCPFEKTLFPETRMWFFIVSIS
ncbi:hypothetical protein RUMCAL_03094 [Ruminococcus callidus ATCC 27760]|uniref:Uncharacterized protein n=1 Tax=Ruminococcus callidus ATCC 27760 TaxID=411473 RepID=U2LGR1_9FIRM|nr:hypothetical protein RUMCAL_03094 [Ruminococcus callidus ATCC 27760]